MRFITLCLILVVADITPTQALGVIHLIGGCDTPGEAFCAAVSGNYAYVADGDSGLRVITVADPANPVEVGHCRIPGWARGVAAGGDYTYVAGYDSGLVVVSSSNPSQPAVVGQCDTRGKAVGVSVRGGYAYVAASDSGLRIISVADPWNPVEVGQCQVAGSANTVATSGDLVYVGDSYGLAVISVADPAHPRTVNGWLFNAPVLAVAATATRACVTVKGQAMHVFSVGDSARITHLGQYGSYYWARGSAVGGDFAYVAADEDGLRVISIADPVHPEEVAFYDEPDWWANGVTVSGGYAYVAYGGAGLQVFQELGGVEENPQRQAAGYRLAGTVVRRIPAGARAFDALGRRTLFTNAGVYFVREGQSQAVTKMVVGR